MPLQNLHDPQEDLVRHLLKILVKDLHERSSLPPQPKIPKRREKSRPQVPQKQDRLNPAWEMIIYSNGNDCIQMKITNHAMNK